jgi:hypothetical protein
VQRSIINNWVFIGRGSNQASVKRNRRTTIAVDYRLMSKSVFPLPEALNDPERAAAALPAKAPSEEGSMSKVLTRNGAMRHAVIAASA